MRSLGIASGLAVVAAFLAGCSPPEGRPIPATVFSLRGIDGTALPTHGTASGSLALSVEDELFILSSRDTAGSTSVDMGAYHWAGPFESSHVNLILLPDVDSIWHAKSYGDSVILMRRGRAELYLRR
jgi:hypothetical protein